MKLIYLVMALLVLNSTSESRAKETRRCVLENNLSDYKAYSDYQLMDKILNIDTLTHYFDPRNSIYINLIGIVTTDSSEVEPRFFTNKVLIYGDTIADKEFETYFKKQYQVYIDSLMKRFPVMIDSIEEDCPNGFIHQRKIRFCG